MTLRCPQSGDLTARARRKYTDTEIAAAPTLPPYGGLSERIGAVVFIFSMAGLGRVTPGA